MTTWSTFLLDFVGDARLSKILSSFLPGLLATGALFLIALTVEPNLWKGMDNPSADSTIVNSQKPEEPEAVSQKPEKSPTQKQVLEARIQTTNQKLKLEGDWLAALDKGAGASLQTFIKAQSIEKKELKNLMTELNGLRNESYSKLMGFSQDLFRDTERLADLNKKLGQKPAHQKPLLTLFYDYLMQFILPGLILGFFIGRLARTLIVEKFYKKKDSPVSLDTLLAHGKMTLESYSNLVSRTYDYSAICASNAIGLFLFGIVWMYFGMDMGYSPWGILLPGLTCVLMTGVLLYAGQKSYAKFVKSKGIWEEAKNKNTQNQSSVRAES